jgi:hypothetical protein
MTTTYLQRTILAFGTPISLLLTLTAIPLLLPLLLPLIFLALTLQLVLVLLALLLILLVVLVILLRQLPHLLNPNPNAQESSKVTTRHVSTSSGSSSSFHTRKLLDTSHSNAQVRGKMPKLDFRRRLGSCHETEGMDTDTLHSGYAEVDSNATFGIDSPRKRNFM